MTIVVDTSIELKWVLEEPGSDAAEVLVEKISQLPRYGCSMPETPYGAARFAGN